MQPLAYLTLTNNGGLVLYDLSDETAMIGYNDENPKECKIRYDMDGDPMVITDFGTYHLYNFTKAEYPNSKSW